MTIRPELDRLIAESVAKVKAMSESERSEMIRAQGESWARAEASWPKARWHMEGGIKVYESYEDYCND